MRFRVKNLGVLRQAEFSLGDLTILCGGNNTGKTYATYALFGFLTFWRQVMSLDVPDDKIQQLLNDGATRLSLVDFIKLSESILAKACKVYAQQLPMIFAASAELYKESAFDVIAESNEIRPVENFERRMTTAKSDLFMLTKKENSDELVVTLLVEKNQNQIPNDSIKYVIADAIKEIIWGSLFPRPFMASTERTGAVVFRNELDFSRNRILAEMAHNLVRNQQWGNPFVNPYGRVGAYIVNDLQNAGTQKYALPVQMNVEFIHQLETTARNNSFLVDNYPDVLENFSDIVSGTYMITSNNELYFVPKGTNVRLTMGESSSAVRSLLDLSFYLQHVAQRGDLLMVDEPELNLHPENQCRIARLFARLVNLGIKVFVTTHSDYIIKELDTLIMLHQDLPHLRHIAQREGYHPTELLVADKIKVYMTDKVLLEPGQPATICTTLTPAEIRQDRGIAARSFDTTIDDMNVMQQEIVWGGE
jgi:hypothetical protein